MKKVLFVLVLFVSLLAPKPVATLPKVCTGAGPIAVQWVANGSWYTWSAKDHKTGATFITPTKIKMKVVDCGTYIAIVK